MDRRALITAVTLGCLAVPLAAEARAPAKGARIGYLAPFSPTNDLNLKYLLQGLGKLGYVAGQNIDIEYRFANERPERLPALVAELVQLKVDVIVAAAPSASEAAKQATSTIPIVFAVSGDPVAAGLVASLARPGGNITGLASLGAELVGKELELLKAVAPKIARVAVLQNPTNPGHVVVLRQAQGAAKSLGLQLQVLEARTHSEIDAAFAAMSGLRVGAVLVLRDAVFRTQRAQIAALTARSRLPAVYGFREHVEAGGLMAYGASVPHMFGRAATYVDKILRGAKPADLPVEQPTELELVINLKTARALGLTIPHSVLLRADEVIE